VNANAGNGGTRAERGLFTRLHDPFRNPLGDRPATSGPLIVTGTHFRERFVAMRDSVEADARLIPARAPVSESPFAKNLNTGGNASNSRFFSDCYSRCVRQISDLIEFLGVVSLPQSTSFGAEFRLAWDGSTKEQVYQGYTKGRRRPQKVRAAPKGRPNGFTTCGNPRC
jgi:hypothetical protein